MKAVEIKRRARVCVCVCVCVWCAEGGDQTATGNEALTEAAARNSRGLSQEVAVLANGICVVLCRGVVPSDSVSAAETHIRCVELALLLCHIDVATRLSDGNVHRHSDDNRRPQHADTATTPLGHDPARDVDVVVRCSAIIKRMCASTPRLEAHLNTFALDFGLTRATA
jgi:hypothetical protein